MPILYAKDSFTFVVLLSYLYNVQRIVLPYLYYMQRIVSPLWYCCHTYIKFHLFGIVAIPMLYAKYAKDSFTFSVLLPPMLYAKDCFTFSVLLPYLCYTQRIVSPLWYCCHTNVVCNG